MSEKVWYETVSHRFLTLEKITAVCTIIKSNQSLCVDVLFIYVTCRNVMKKYNIIIYKNK